MGPNSVGILTLVCAAKMCETVKHCFLQSSGFESEKCSVPSGCLLSKFRNLFLRENHVETESWKFWATVFMFPFRACMIGIMIATEDLAKGATVSHHFHDHTNNHT